MPKATPAPRKTSRPREHILVVVHPGSACGSADENLGYEDANSARLALMEELWNWSGHPLVVIDGELSDELQSWRSGHRDLGVALTDALAAAKAEGAVSLRIRGDDDEDFDQQAAMAKLIVDHGWTPERQQFTVTGAWFHPDDGGGCVGSVHDVLAAQGFKVAIGPGAVELEFDEPSPQPVRARKFRA